MVVIRVATSASASPTSTATTYFTKPPCLRAAPCPRVSTSVAITTGTPCWASGLACRRPCGMPAVVDDRPLVGGVLPRSGGCRYPDHSATPIGSPPRSCEALQGVRVRDVYTSVPDLHRARFPQPPQSPGDRLPVGPHYARQLLVGVADGYDAIVLARNDAPVFAEAEYEGSQAGRNFFVDQAREPFLVGGEPLAQDADSLHPHLGVAAHEVLEVLALEEQQDGRLEGLDDHHARGVGREAGPGHYGRIFYHENG